MKKIIIIAFPFLVAILLLSSMVKKPAINIKSFVDVKWCIDDTTVSTIICFKKDNTFWHYRIYKSRLDSVMFSKWGIENDKLYLLDNDIVSDFKFYYMKIISCDKNSMTLEDVAKKKYIRFCKKHF